MKVYSSRKKKTKEDILKLKADKQEQRVPESTQYNINIPCDLEACQFGSWKNNYYNEVSLKDIISKQEFLKMLNYLNETLEEAWQTKRRMKLIAFPYVEVGLAIFMMLLLGIATVTFYLLIDSTSDDGLYAVSLTCCVLFFIVSICGMIYNYNKPFPKQVTLQDIVSEKLQKVIEEINQKYTGKMLLTYKDSNLLNIRITHYL